MTLFYVATMSLLFNGSGAFLGHRTELRAVRQLDQCVLVIKDALERPARIKDAVLE